MGLGGTVSLGKWHRPSSNQHLLCSLGLKTASILGAEGHFPVSGLRHGQGMHSSPNSLFKKGAAGAHPIKHSRASSHVNNREIPWASTQPFGSWNTADGGIYYVK